MLVEVGSLFLLLVVVVVRLVENGLVLVLLVCVMWIGRTRTLVGCRVWLWDHTICTRTIMVVLDVVAAGVQGGIVIAVLVVLVVLFQRLERVVVVVVVVMPRPCGGCCTNRSLDRAARTRGDAAAAGTDAMVMVPGPQMILVVVVALRSLTRICQFRIASTHQTKRAVAVAAIQHHSSVPKIENFSKSVSDADASGLQVQDWTVRCPRTCRQ